MVVKGLISAIDLEAKTVDVILPEHSNVVVRPDGIYTKDVLRHLSVNDFVLVVVFNNDFTDTFLLLPSVLNTACSGSTTSSNGITVIYDEVSGALILSGGGISAKVDAGVLILTRVSAEIKDDVLVMS